MMSFETRAVSEKSHKTQQSNNQRPYGRIHHIKRQTKHKGVGVNTICFFTRFGQDISSH